MIITTTNHIENNSIKQYLGVINTNVVLGTNLFSDFAASLTDVLGGRSDSYQSKLNLIYERVTNELERKANYLKADAILGLQIDFDEISGNGKSMFMVSASGTAVVLEDSLCENRYLIFQKLNEIRDYFIKGFLSEDEYNYEKKRITENYNNPISREVKTIKQNQEYEDQIARAQKEEEARIQEEKARIQEEKKEEERKTFIFGKF